MANEKMLLAVLGFIFSTMVPNFLFIYGIHDPLGLFHSINVLTSWEVYIFASFREKG